MSLTDPGRRWDGHKVSVRDKAMASNPVTNPDSLHRSYHATSDIIKALETGSFPNRVWNRLAKQACWWNTPGGGDTLNDQATD